MVLTGINSCSRSILHSHLRNQRHNTALQCENLLPLNGLGQGVQVLLVFIFAPSKLRRIPSLHLLTAAALYAIMSAYNRSFGAGILQCRPRQNGQHASMGKTSSSHCAREGGHTAESLLQSDTPLPPRSIAVKEAAPSPARYAGVEWQRAADPLQFGWYHGSKRLSPQYGRSCFLFYPQTARPYQ